MSRAWRFGSSARVILPDRPSRVVRACFVGGPLAVLLAVSAPAATTRVTASADAVAAVALEDAAEVALRGPPWRVARRVAVPAGPHNVAASREGPLFAVTSPPAGAVTLIRASGALVRTRRAAA